MTVARSEAWPWVKLPVIWTGPLNDDVWNAGDEYTSPSRTIATSSRGELLPGLCVSYDAAARLLNFVRPALFKVTSTA